MDRIYARGATQYVLAGCVIVLFCCGLMGLVIALVVTLSLNTGTIVTSTTATPAPTASLVCPFFSNQPNALQTAPCGQGTALGACTVIGATTATCTVGYFTGGTSTAPISETVACIVSSDTCVEPGCQCLSVPFCDRDVTSGGGTATATFRCIDDVP